LIREAKGCAWRETERRRRVVGAGEFRGREVGFFFGGRRPKCSLIRSMMLMWHATSERETVREPNSIVGGLFIIDRREELSILPSTILLLAEVLMKL